MVTRTQILACQFEGDMHVWTTVRKLICWLFWKVVTKNLIVLFFTALTKCQILLCLFKENVWTAVRRIYMLTWMRDCFFGSNLDIVLTKTRVFILRECMNNSEENPICWLMDVRKVVTLVYLCFFFSIVADYQEISSKFSNNRMQLPTIFISTPKDKFTSMWTKEKPSKPVS